MANVTLTFDAAEAQRIVKALCLAAGMPINAANAKKALTDYIQATVTNVERSQAESAAVGAVTVTPVTVT